MHLVLGGARSGKTAYAEQVALTKAHFLQVPVTYVATGVAMDDEMAMRIERHRTLRDKEFQLVECPRNLDKQVAALDPKRSGVLLIDCLSTYLGTASYDGLESVPEEQLFLIVMKLLESLQEYPWPVIIVSNEVGMGIVPLYESARVYRDVLGRVNASFANRATDVTWMMAGMAVALKRDGTLSPFCELWPERR